MKREEAARAKTNLTGALIIVAAGKGTRAGPGPPKQFRRLGGVPLLARTLRPFAASGLFRQVVLVVPDPDQAKHEISENFLATLSRKLHIKFAQGGPTRQASTAAGLRALDPADLVLVHDGVRPFVTEDLVMRVFRAAADRGAAIPVYPVSETIKRLETDGTVQQTVDRGGLVLAQTPQGFRWDLLESAMARAEEENYVGTDEAELVERSGHPVAVVEGTPDNLKITTPSDLELGEARVRDRESSGGRENIRIGIGYDVHPLVPGRPLVLGGIRIAHTMGPSGHSDGDLVCHAATDALLGAAGLPDIGQMFPDTDPAYRGARSIDLLARVKEKLQGAGFKLGNLDLVVLAEEPLLAPHLGAIRTRLAEVLDCGRERIGLRGKRGEGLGFVGRKEGMAAHAVALLVREGGRKRDEIQEGD